MILFIAGNAYSDFGETNKESCAHNLLQCIFLVLKMLKANKTLEILRNQCRTEVVDANFQFGVESNSYYSYTSYISGHLESAPL
ncbi:MAG: hypothetical protein RPR97_14015 [Colwellia sp.]|jgi:hypothetical protein